MRLAKTYYHVKGCKTRIQVHQGGTRSGKTYSILLALIEWCYTHQNWGWWLTICRRTFPSLRASVYRDFREILLNEGWYSENNHNRTSHIYNLFGNNIEFIGVDNASRIRGRKRHILFINEANELSLEHWRQLSFRTTEKIIIDYNPSDEYHWIYEQVIPRDDATFFQTTYLDNPFLDAGVVNEIERLKETDENFWRVYGLGERGISRSTIFTHFKVMPQFPEGFKPHHIGLDFGYTNHPSAIVEVSTDGHGFAVREIAYATKLSNADIAGILRDNNPHRLPVIADSAEPKSIHEIAGHGHVVLPSRKGPDSLRAGIQFMQSRPLYIHSGSENLIKELRNYKWLEDKNGNPVNVPVDANNHAIDAMRYAITFNQTRPNFGKYTMG